MWYKYHLSKTHYLPIDKYERSVCTDPEIVIIVMSYCSKWMSKKVFNFHHKHKMTLHKIIPIRQLQALLVRENSIVKAK